MNNGQEFPDEKELKNILEKYPSRRSGVLAVLQLFQKKYGCVTKEAISKVADILDMNPAEVESVASFYTFYSFCPGAKYVISVCTNVSCGLNGAEGIFAYLKNRLNLQENGVTADGKFGLKTVECLGACDSAPVVQVNDAYYGNMTVEKIEKLVADLEKKP